MAAGIYEVTFPDGARISESPRFPIEVACLKKGTMVTVVEVKGDKARITKPVRGWCSSAHIAKKEAAGGATDGKSRAAAVPKIEVGDRCVLIDGRVGTVRYAGQTAFAKGNWFGVALDKPEGKHNGMVKGKRYFDCPPQHGVFVRMNKIAKVKSAKKASTKSSGSTVYIRTPEGARLGIRCQPNDDTTNLKYKIQDQLGIPPAQQSLSIDGATLGDGVQLSHRGLFNPNVTVNLATAAPSGSPAQNGGAAASTSTGGARAQATATKNAASDGKTAGASIKSDDKPGRARWYGCWFFEGEESYVDLSVNVGAKRMSGEAVDEDNDNLVVNGTVKQDDQGHPKWTFKMTMKGEPTIINVGVLINGRIKGVWKVLDSWGKFEMCPAKNLVGKGDKRAGSKDNRII